MKFSIKDFFSKFFCSDALKNSMQNWPKMEKKTKDLTLLLHGSKPQVTRYIKVTTKSCEVQSLPGLTR